MRGMIRGLALSALMLVAAAPAAAGTIFSDPPGQMLTSGAISVFRGSGFLSVQGTATVLDDFAFSWSFISVLTGDHTVGPTSMSTSSTSSDMLSASITHQGQSFSFFGCQHPDLGLLCGTVRIQSLNMSANTSPPFAGDLHATVPGTFSLLLDVFTFQPLPVPKDTLFFLYHGPAAITLAWQPEQEQWLFESGLGVIEPTPEPTTLLLWGTGAAGLGLARWYRRRACEREHAA